MRPQIREREQNMTSSVAETSSDVIAAFMQEVIVQYHSFGGQFRRLEPRESVAIPVRVCPLSEDLKLDGETFLAVTRDVSCSGIGFFHTRAIDSPFVQVVISSPETSSEMNLLARVEHCTPCGGFVIIGCRIVGSAESSADESDS